MPPFLVSLLHFCRCFLPTNLVINSLPQHLLLGNPNPNSGFSSNLNSLTLSFFLWKYLVVFIFLNKVISDLNERLGINHSVYSLAQVGTRSGWDVLPPFSPSQPSGCLTASEGGRERERQETSPRSQKPQRWLYLSWKSPELLHLSNRESGRGTLKILGRLVLTNCWFIIINNEFI